MGTNEVTQWEQRKARFDAAAAKLKTCSKCGGVKGAVAPTCPTLHGFGAPAPCDCVEVRPLPSLEEFARFLADRPGSDSREAMRAQSELLRRYAAVWGNFEGIPAAQAQQMADALSDEMHATGAERLAESL